jgi:hypothetical protein
VETSHVWSVVEVCPSVLQLTMACPLQVTEPGMQAVHAFKLGAQTACVALQSWTGT